MTTPPLPTSRRQRSLERKFRKLDRKIARKQAKDVARAYRRGGSLPGHRSWVPAPPAGGRRSRLPQWVVPLTILGLMLGLSYWVSSGGLQQQISALPPTAPPPGVEAADDPLGAPPAVPGEGGYDFTRRQDGSSVPVAWDPCRPVHYVVYGTAPAGGETLVQDAVAEMSAATGLRFVYDGPTDEVPTNSSHQDFQPDRYGQRWAPLLIAWTTPEEVADLGGITAGTGGPDIRRAEDGTLVYVSGQVALDSSDFGQLVATGGHDVARAITLHELGHALGLAHYNDPEQIMYAEASYDVTQLGDGDRRGLAALGKGSCEDDL